MSVFMPCLLCGFVLPPLFAAMIHGDADGAVLMVDKAIYEKRRKSMDYVTSLLSKWLKYNPHNVSAGRKPDKGL